MNDIKDTLADLKKGCIKTINDIQYLAHENDLYIYFFRDLDISYDILYENVTDVFVVVTKENYIVGIGDKNDLDVLYSEVLRKINDIKNDTFKTIGKIEAVYI